MVARLRYVWYNRSTGSPVTCGSAGVGWDLISIDDMNDVRTAYDATRRGCVLIAYHMLNDDEKSGIMSEVQNFIEDCAPARFFELSDMEAMGTLALHDNLEKTRNMAALAEPKMIRENIRKTLTTYLYSHNEAF